MSIRATAAAVVSRLSGDEGRRLDLFAQIVAAQAEQKANLERHNAAYAEAEAERRAIDEKLEAIKRDARNAYAAAQQKIRALDADYAAVPYPQIDGFVAELERVVEDIDGRHRATSRQAGLPDGTLRNLVERLMAAREAIAAANGLRTKGLTDATTADHLAAIRATYDGALARADAVAEIRRDPTAHLLKLAGLS